MNTQRVKQIYILVITASVCVLNSAVAQETATTENPKETTSESEAIATLVGDKLKASFEAGDAAALSALFTENGEFIDGERVLYSGRENIQTEFAALFEEPADRKMELVVDSVRQVADGVIVEDGHAWIQTGDAGATTVSQYCTVLVRQGDEWKIASLRDIESEYASAADRLTALTWLIGEWIDESDAGVVEYEFGWSGDNSFIVGSYLIRSSEDEDFSGSVRIGWDPGTKQFKSWTFDSEGGVAVGHWHPIEEGWMIKNTGTRSDGVSGSSTNYYELAGEDRILWKSFDRHVGGEEQPDVEVTLVRKPPAPGGASDEHGE